MIVAEDAGKWVAFAGNLMSRQSNLELGPLTFERRDNEVLEKQFEGSLLQPGSIRLLLDWTLAGVPGWTG